LQFAKGTSRSMNLANLRLRCFFPDLPSTSAVTQNTTHSKLHRSRSHQISSSEPVVFISLLDIQLITMQFLNALLAIVAGMATLCLASATPLVAKGVDMVSPPPGVDDMCCLGECNVCGCDYCESCKSCWVSRLICTYSTYVD
jgi:hypothetical protein